MTIQLITENGQVVDEYDDGRPEETKEQTNESATEPQSEVSAQSGRVATEDLTEFDRSDISIQIMLHKADDHPQGRLVSVIIHNFSGAPVIGTFRETELTEKSRLDSIHKAIYPLMQRFLLDQASRAQKKLQEVAPKTVASPASTPNTTSTKTPAPTLSSTSPARSPSTSPTPTKPVSKEGNKKKSKYQAIPMF